MGIVIRFISLTYAIIVKIFTVLCYATRLALGLARHAGIATMQYEPVVRYGEQLLREAPL